MDDSMKNKSGKKEEKKYIVTRPQKVVSEYGYDPSLARYLLSRLFFPILLCPILILIKGGWLFIPIILFYVIGTSVYKYYDLYPKSRPATETEIRVYKLLRRREMIKLRIVYNHRVKYYDVYGFSKYGDEEYSDTIKRAIKYETQKNGGVCPDRLSNAYERGKSDELKIRGKMERLLSETEEEYGPNWIAETKEELKKHGMDTNIIPPMGKREVNEWVESL